MINKLLLTAALLLPGLACAGNPTANLSVQIAPAGSSPAVPAGAKAAGFTTLAANYDFSSPFYAIQSNWLSCWPQDGSTKQFYHQSSGPGINTVPPSCNNISQVFDAVAAANVLLIQWNAVDCIGGSGNCSGTGTYRLQTIMTESNDGTRGTTFPNGHYMEIEFRMSQNQPFAAGTGESVAFWEYGSRINGSFGHPIERDAVEYGTTEFGSNNDSAIHNWAQGNNPNQFLWAGVNVPASQNQYHKFAWRTTSDGNTSVGCAYIDGVLKSCVNEQLSATQLASARNDIIVNNGNVAGSQGMYIKTIRVWSCANWQTTMCNGSVLSGAP